MTPINIFIFRKDLRLADNIGLIEASKSKLKILPCFIFNPRQLDSNPFRGENAVQFMLGALADLDLSLREIGGRLFKFHGFPEQVLHQLFELPQISVKTVFANTDYTPFSKERDLALRSECKKHGVEFRAFHDSLLTIPGSVLKKDGKPYTIYTPFKNSASKLTVLEPEATPEMEFFDQRLPGEFDLGEERILPTRNSRIALQGSRSEGLSLIKGSRQLNDYSNSRNFPALNGTSRLSAHNKFGTISIREIFKAFKDHFGSEHTLISELYWRDFFSHIGWHFPHVFSGAFHKQYDAIRWENDESKFKRWCNAETGFPIVDAGMRELNETGLMHNRVRMIVASFLTKDLHIDWHWGEKYFATKLIDYDPAVNNGNWQWTASTGCDAQPYFRIFNPWLQQEKYDPECIYIKRWVKELANLTTKQINDHSRACSINGYPAPVVDHAWAKGEAEALFRRASQG